MIAGIVLLNEECNKRKNSNGMANIVLLLVMLLLANNSTTLVHMHMYVHMCTLQRNVRTCVYTHVHVFALMYNCTAAIVRKYVLVQRIGVAQGWTR